MSSPDGFQVVAQLNSSNNIEPLASVGTLNVAEEKSLDEALLEKLGYQQELYRGFNWLMAFSFCFTAVGCISSIWGVFPGAMGYGGPAVFAWAWLVCTCFTLCIATSMAEICASFPFAGSVYHWAGCMASENGAPLAAYVCGWFNFLGNAGGDAFFAYTFATNVSNLMAYGTTGATLSEGAFTGIAIGACVCWAILNFLRVDSQGWLNNFSSFWQISATFIVIVSLFATCAQSGNSSTASDMFFKFENTTGFSDWYVVLLGLIQPMLCVSGYEAAGHMSEETHRATVYSPRSIVLTCVCSCGLGFVFITSLLYGSASQLDDLFSANGTGVVPTDILITCAGESFGTGLSALLAVGVFFNGISSLTVTTRITYAMARDGAFPFSPLFRYVDPRNRVPVGAIVLTLVFDIMLILVNLGNSTAFLAITGITTIGYQISYAIPIFIRITHQATTFPQSKSYQLGPKWGIIVGWISFMWLVITSILFLLPSAYPVTAENMNYTSVIVGGVSLIGGINWIVSARYYFGGPKRIKE